MGFGMQWHQLDHMHMRRENYKYVTDCSRVRRTNLRRGSRHHICSLLVRTDRSCDNGTAERRHYMLYIQSQRNHRIETV